MYKHGMAYTRPYRIWKGLRRRCESKKSPDYKHYGGRGIKVDKHWAVFQHFWDDMQSTYAPNLTLDRIDNNGNYTKENCRWTTQKVQVNNTRRCRILTLDGKSMNITQWEEYMGRKKGVIKYRLNHLGWSVRDAILGK